jgi:MoaA/NifB/PqqE/SkfB family radical SAM enzyme
LEISRRDFPIIGKMKSSRKIANTLRAFMTSGPRIPPPRNLTIETTSFCNLRCPMCPKTNDAVNTSESRTLSLEVFDRLIPLFPFIESLELNGLWGEAFLHPDQYLYMLERIKAHRVDVYTISNGTRITDDLARRLVELDLNRLTVSMDAATPETYARLRPPGRFEDVIAGLERIRDWKAKLGRTQPRVEMAFLGMKSNIHELPDFVRLAHRVGAYGIILQALGEVPLVAGESIAKNDKATGRRYFSEAQRIGAELGVAVSLLPPDQFEEDRGDRNAPLTGARLRKNCRDPWNKAVIATNGDVLPCCACNRPMGNLLAQSFMEIWRGPAYTELRRQILTPDPPEMCRYCTGMPWVEDSLADDIRFFMQDLFWRRAYLRMRRNPRLRRIKHALFPRK